jgi:hypothetical protein
MEDKQLQGAVLLLCSILVFAFFIRNSWRKDRELTIKIFQELINGARTLQQLINGQEQEDIESVIPVLIKHGYVLTLQPGNNPTYVITSDGRRRHKKLTG